MISVDGLAAADVASNFIQRWNHNRAFAPNQQSIPLLLSKRAGLHTFKFKESPLQDRRKSFRRDASALRDSILMHLRSSQSKGDKVVRDDTDLVFMPGNQDFYKRLSLERKKDNKLGAIRESSSDGVDSHSNVAGGNRKRAGTDGQQRRAPLPAALVSEISTNSLGHNHGTSSSDLLRSLPTKKTELSTSNLENSPLGHPLSKSFPDIGASEPDESNSESSDDSRSLGSILAGMNEGTCSCQVVRSISPLTGSTRKEHSLYEAYLYAIRSAKHYIYIENHSVRTCLNYLNAFVVRLISRMLQRFGYISRPC
jgi:phosphatidylserine/phosphatidylglycerophosphate/cardiolipin synthase-like enzyme